MRFGEAVGTGPWFSQTGRVALAAAALLPLFMFALFTISAGYDAARRDVEAATLMRSERVVAAIDSRLAEVSAAMRVLTTIKSIRDANWTQARVRAREIQRIYPEWRNVTVVDFRSGKQVFDLRPSSAPAPIFRKPIGSAGPDRQDLPRFGSLEPEPDGHGAIPVSLAIPDARGVPAYLLTVSLDPVIVQRLLVSLAPEDGVSAVVDRQGHFIARTRDWRKRLGKPATSYVKQAIAGGRSGIYRGVTWEGFSNYTAFSTSPQTGWSAHVAVSSTLIDRPRQQGVLFTVLAAAVSLLFCVFLLMMAYRSAAAQRASDARVHQAERLETVGRLTGGIAHDFNNMLAIVIGSLDLARRRLAAGTGDVSRYLDNAADGAQRAADLTRRLLAFSRQQSLSPAPIDANTCVAGLVELLRRTMPESIKIRTELAADLWPVFVDVAQLENAIVNLATNARDAMPEGGVITISTLNCPAKAPAFMEMVLVRVGDTGIGMAPKVAARAIEPFFTTKPVDKGTGLGLSQINGFATQSGGTVAIESAVGHGTQVTISFPRYLGDAPPQRLPEPKLVPKGTEEEVLMVVEDEQAVRSVHVEALRELGYTVFEAESGEAALALLAIHPHVQMILTDIVMPGMGGRELARRLREERPDLAIVYVTAFHTEAEGATDAHVLRKPVQLDALAMRVRHELNNRERRGNVSFRLTDS